MDGAMLIKGYNPNTGNHMGITLDTTPVSNPVSSSTIAGDLTPIPSSSYSMYDWLNQPVYYSFDTLGNVVVDPGTSQQGRADALNGSSGNDLMLGLGGGDILYGAAGDDRIYADNQISVASAIAGGKLPNTGTGVRGDWLAGGSGADTLVGSNGNDVLRGGGGADLLIAGAGDDDILGDSDIVAFAWDDWKAPSFDWTVTDRTDGARWYLRDDTSAAPIVITGGTQYGDNKVFRGKDANGVSHLYTFVSGDRATGGDLIVDGATLIKDYRPGQGNGMGIAFSDAFIRAANDSAWRVAA